MTATDPMIHEDDLPGEEAKLDPKPDWSPRYPGSGRLEGKVAIVTGGDSGIGRAVAALFAREGADVAILYLNEHEDAQQTAKIVTHRGPPLARHPRRHRRQGVLREGGGGGGRDARRRRHPRQQCRRAAPRSGHHRHHRGTAAPHLPDQHLRHVLPDAGGAAAPEGGLGDHQLHLGDDVSGLEGAARLFVDQGRDHRLHPLAVRKSGRRGHPRQRGRAGADLDPAQPVRRRLAREARRLRRKHADGPPRPAQRGRARLPVPRLRGFAPTCPARCCTRTAGRSSTGDALRLSRAKSRDRPSEAEAADAGFSTSLEGVPRLRSAKVRQVCSELAHRASPAKRPRCSTSPTSRCGSVAASSSTAPPPRCRRAAASG